MKCTKLAMTNEKKSPVYLETAARLEIIAKVKTVNNTNVTSQLGLPQVSQWTPFLCGKADLRERKMKI